MTQIQRNDPCPCGSGKKYKKCCLGREEKKILPQITFTRNKYVYLALVAIFILSLFLRYYGFQQPHGLTFDEGLYAHLLAPQLQQDATNYSTQEAYRRMIAQSDRFIPEYLDRPLFKHPPLYCYLIAFTYNIFGRSDLAAVSVSIVMGSLMIPIVFFLGKFLYDDRVGLLAAAFLCFEPVHWVCSERIWMETTLSFFMFLGISLFAFGTKHKYLLILSGLSIGLGMFTKYPAAVSPFIIMSYVLMFERKLFKEKYFWALCLLPFVVILPWIIWNVKVYGNFFSSTYSAHGLSGLIGNRLGYLLTNKVKILGLLFIPLIGFVYRNKIKLIFKTEGCNEKILIRRRILGIVIVLLPYIMLSFIPNFRRIFPEAFVWKNAIVTGWANIIDRSTRYFYLIRLSELSPLHLYAYFSIFLFFGKNKGDKLLILTSVWIISAFITLGNYQTRYILPAVPFLVILSARLFFWIYDRLSGPKTYQMVLKVVFIGISVYFVIRTLKVDSLLAIGPDFGYF